MMENFSTNHIAKGRKQLTYLREGMHNSEVFSHLAEPIDYNLIRESIPNTEIYELDNKNDLEPFYKTLEEDVNTEKGTTKMLLVTITELDYPDIDKAIETIDSIVQAKGKSAIGFTNCRSKNKKFVRTEF